MRLLFALSVPVRRSRSRRNETNQALNLAPFANMAAHPLADQLAASLSDPSVVFVLYSCAGLIRSTRSSLFPSRWRAIAAG